MGDVVRLPVTQRPRLTHSNALGERIEITAEPGIVQIALPGMRQRWTPNQAWAVAGLLRASGAPRLLARQIESMARTARQLENRNA